MSQWLKLASVRHQVAIAGQVTNAATGQPIAGAQVKLTGGSAAFQARIALQESFYGATRATLIESAIDGSFYFLDLPESSLYTITVSLPKAGTRYAESVQATAIRVSCEAEQIQRATVNLALPPTAVSGQIKDSKNEPVRMATVQLVGSPERTFSDEQGRYLLQELEASDLVAIAVSAQGCEPVTQQISLDRGQTKILDFELKRKQLSL